jgi:hypothetical protein
MRHPETVAPPSTAAKGLCHGSKNAAVEGGATSLKLSL